MATAWSRIFLISSTFFAAASADLTASYFTSFIRLPYLACVQFAGEPLEVLDEALGHDSIWSGRRQLLRPGGFHPVAPLPGAHLGNPARVDAEPCRDVRLAVTPLKHALYKGDILVADHRVVL